MGGSFSALLAGGGALANALEKQDDEALKVALQANPKLSGCALSMRDGNTASHFAAAEGRLDYLKILVEAYDDGRKKRKKKHGAKYTARMLNRRNLNGQTTLMLACKYGHSAVVTWLLQLGGNPLLFDAIHSRTCLHYAALYGHRNCVAALFAEDAVVKMLNGPLLLRDATVWDSQGHHKFVNARAALGFTAIHMSASQGHWQAVTELLKNDASLAVQCQGVLRSHIRNPPRWKPNSTPLHIAAARGSTSMVRHMLHALANKMLRDANTVDVRQIRDVVEMRPVDIATSFGFPRITALLDPSRSPELLAYVTAGSGPMKLGAPALSVLMSRLLRSQLLDQLVAVEVGLAAKRTAGAVPARAPSMKSAATRAQSMRRRPSILPAGTNQAGPSPLMVAPSASPSRGVNFDPFGASGALRMLSIAPRQPSRLPPPSSPLQQQRPPLPRTAGSLDQSPARSFTAGQPSPGGIQAMLAGSEGENVRDSAAGEEEEEDGQHHEEEEEEEAESRRRNSLVMLSMRRLPVPGEDNSSTVEGGGDAQQLSAATPFASAGFADNSGSGSGRGYWQQFGGQSAVDSLEARGPRSGIAITGGATPGGFRPDLEHHSSVMQGRAGRPPSMRRIRQPIDNELILDERHGDSYTGRPRQLADALDGDMADLLQRSGTSATNGLGSSPVTPSALNADPRQAGGGVVFAQMDTRQGSVQFVVSRNSNVLTRAPSTASLAADECDICFDAPLEAAIKACRHEMCVSCLRGVCEADPDHTPRCPFCRSIIDRIVEEGAHCPTHYPVPLPKHKEGGSGGSDQAAMGQLALALDDVCDAAIAAQR